MLYALDTETAKELKTVCLRCKRFGHKTNECPVVVTNQKLVCPRCGKKHHPRDCYRGPSFISRAKTNKQAKKSAVAPKTTGAELPMLNNAVPTKRGERAQEFGRATMLRTRKRFSKEKDDGGQEDKRDNAWALPSAHGTTALPRAMVSHHCPRVQSRQHSILFLNGKTVGNPHQDALRKMTIPPKEARDSLSFHTNYVCRRECESMTFLFPCCGA